MLQIHQSYHPNPTTNKKCRASKAKGHPNKLNLSIALSSNKKIHIYILTISLLPDEAGKKKKIPGLSLTDLRESVPMPVLLCVTQRVQRVRARAGLEKRKKNPQLNRSEGEGAAAVVAVREAESEGEGEGEGWLGKK